jgi:hypothetical protein
MNLLRRLIRRWIGKDRYHEQAQEIQNRHLRLAILDRRLQVIERRGEKR